MRACKIYSSDKEQELQMWDYLQNLTPVSICSSSYCKRKKKLTFIKSQANITPLTLTNLFSTLCKNPSNESLLHLKTQPLWKLLKAVSIVRIYHFEWGKRKIVHKDTSSFFLPFHTKKRKTEKKKEKKDKI